MSNQERRLMRRLGMVGGGAGCTAGPFNQPVDPRAQAVQEQDWQRNKMAERLLEIGLENLYPSQFVDTKDGPEDSPTQTVKDWFTRVAEASISAAEVIYPEPVMEITEETARRWGLTPAAAQEGAQSVGGFPVERPGQEVDQDLLESLRASASIPPRRGEG